MLGLALALVVITAPPAGLDTETLVALGVPRERAVIAFAWTPELQKAAHELVLKRSRDSAASSTRARAIYDGLKALVGSGRLVPKENSERGGRDTYTAEQLWRLAQRDPPTTVTCYELTSLYIAMARSQGLDAVGGEPIHTQGDGFVGHVVALVRDDRGKTRVDLQNGTIMRDHDTRELSDRELAAHFYNQRAKGIVEANDGLPLAIEALRDGLRVSDTVAELHANLGGIAAITGACDEGMAEAARASALKPSVPYFHFNEGYAAIQCGQHCRGLAALRRALQLKTDYADAKSLARQTLEKHPDLRCQ